MGISVFKAMELNGQALSAQRLRLDVVSSNLANAKTTRTPEGGPYRRRDVALATDVARGRFGEVLHDELMEPTRTVQVQEIVADEAPPRMVFDPNHPDAGPNGYVAMPNINSVEEMVNMITIMRSYKANLNVFSSIKEMTSRALTIGRS
jgi:flagellar basal-body rod protein FlgC